MSKPKNMLPATIAGINAAIDSGEAAEAEYWAAHDASTLDLASVEFKTVGPAAIRQMYRKRNR